MVRVAALLSLTLGVGVAWADVPPPKVVRSPSATATATVTMTVERAEEGSSMEAPLTRLVGVLLEEGHKVCRADGSVDWLERYDTLGFTPLVLAEGLEPNRYRGQVVVAEGQLVGPAPGRPASVPDHEVECPIPQMRSDWVESLHGFRVIREGMGRRGLFRVDRIRAWDGLTVQADGDDLVVRVTNTLRDELLQDVVIVVHYEGCFGKPGTTERTGPTQTLAFGVAVEARLPKLVTQATGRGELTFAAYSVQVRSRPETTAFDLDLSLARAGVEVRCPDR